MHLGNAPFVPAGTWTSYTTVSPALKRWAIVGGCVDPWTSLWKPPSSVKTLGYLSADCVDPWTSL